MEVETQSEQALVLPGALLTSDSAYMSGRGTYTDREGIRSALVGYTVLVNKLVTVRPLKARFTAATGDVVIGRVVQIAYKRWVVDIDGTDRATLHINSVRLEDIQRRKTEEDEQKMRELLCENDLVVAEVRTAAPGQGIGLHIRNENFGRLTGGLLVAVKNSLLARQKTHFHLRDGMRLIFALNGFIWLAPADPATATSTTFEGMAKLRNLVLTLNDADLPIDPETLWEVYAQSASLRAKDLLLPHNREAVATAVRQARLQRHKSSLQG